MYQLFCWDRRLTRKALFTTMEACSKFRSGGQETGLHDLPITSSNLTLEPCEFCFENPRRAWPQGSMPFGE